MNTITLENYRQYKPSDLIARGVHDMLDAVESGMDIITHDWFGYNDVECKCFCCLGGAVLRGMVPQIKACTDSGNYKDAKIRMLLHSNDTERRVACLFDSIRLGNGSQVLIALQEMYGLDSSSLSLVDAIYYKWRRAPFYGELNNTQIEQLSKSIFNLVDALRSIGL